MFIQFFKLLLIIIILIMIFKLNKNFYNSFKIKKKQTYKIPQYYIKNNNKIYQKIKKFNF